MAGVVGTWFGEWVAGGAASGSRLEEDPALQGSLDDRKDTAGRATRMATWNHPGDSVYGLAARSHRVVDAMEDLLGERVDRVLAAAAPAAAAGSGLT